MTTFSYCCSRYIFKHLPVGCPYSSGALLCTVSDYQVSFLEVFLMALDFMMNRHLITIRPSLDVSCADWSCSRNKSGTLTKCFCVWEVGPSVVKRVFQSLYWRQGQLGIRGTQGQLSPHQGAQSPVQPDVLNQTTPKVQVGLFRRVMNHWVQGRWFQASRWFCDFWISIIGRHIALNFFSSTKWHTLIRHFEVVKFFFI